MPSGHVFGGRCKYVPTFKTQIPTGKKNKKFQKANSHD